MKKIAFIIESNAIGGAERVLRDLVNNIDKSLFDVTVISLFKNSVYGGTSQFADSFNCKYRWVIDNGNSLTGKVGSFLINRFPNIFYLLFIRSKYDSLVAFYEGMPTSFIATLKNSVEKIAWLHTSVDLSISVRTKSVLELKRKDYSTYDKILCVSDGVRNGFLALFPDFVNKTYTAYNPINLIRIKNLSDEEKVIPLEERFTFVAVGRIIPCKGYERLIDVAQRLKEENLNFVVWIIGGGGGHVRLMELAKEKSVADFFVFYGNQSNPYPYMKQADCVISSSYIEGFGMTLLEGLALGKLIVATDCHCTGEIIGNNSEYGILVENSEDGLYEGMKRVLTDRNVKSYYEKKAVERARFFDAKNSISRIEALLDC